MVKKRRGLLRAAVGATIMLLLTVSGCDWLKASGSARRVSPFLSELRVSPSSVLCARNFSISFRHDDPQEDISLLIVLFQHTNEQAVRERRVLWESTGDLSLVNSGRATLTHSFACTDPGGKWVVTVQAEDERGHTSNTLVGEVNLNSAG